MFNYVNNFNCTSLENKSLFFLDFIQNVPKFENDHSVSSNKELVTSLIIDQATASALAQAIQDILNE